MTVAEGPYYCNNRGKNGGGGGENGEGERGGEGGIPIATEPYHGKYNNKNAKKKTLK